MLLRCFLWSGYASSGPVEGKEKEEIYRRTGKKREPDALESNLPSLMIARIISCMLFNHFVRFSFYNDTAISTLLLEFLLQSNETVFLVYTVHSFGRCEFLSTPALSSHVSQQWTALLSAGHRLRLFNGLLITEPKIVVITLLVSVPVYTYTNILCIL